MTEKRDIGWRLENWARYCTTQGRSYSRDGLTSTAQNCDRLRKAAQGELGGTGPQRDDVNVDNADAVRIELAMCEMKRTNLGVWLLMYWCYIEQLDPNVVCRKLSIPHRPASIFTGRFRAAQAAIEDAADNGNK